MYAFIHHCIQYRVGVTHADIYKIITDNTREQVDKIGTIILLLYEYRFLFGDQKTI